MVNFPLPPLYSRGTHQYPLDRGWVGPRSGMNAVAKKKFAPLPGIEPGSYSP